MASSTKLALLGLTLTGILMAGLILSISLYPFKIIEFPNDPQVEILNPGKRVEVGGYLRLRMRTIKYWDIGEQITKTLVAPDDDFLDEVSPELTEQPVPLSSTSSFAHLPVGDHTRETIFQVLITKLNPGKDRRIQVRYHYEMVGGRSIDRTSISEPFEVYIPDEFPPGGFREMHKGTHKHMEKR